MKQRITIEVDDSRDFEIGMRVEGRGAKLQLRSGYEIPYLFEGTIVGVDSGKSRVSFDKKLSVIDGKINSIADFVVKNSESIDEANNRMDGIEAVVKNLSSTDLALHGRCEHKDACQIRTEIRDVNLRFDKHITKHMDACGRCYEMNAVVKDINSRIDDINSRLVMIWSKRDQTSFDKKLSVIDGKIDDMALHGRCDRMEKNIGECVDRIKDIDSKVDEIANKLNALKSYTTDSVLKLWRHLREYLRE